MVNEQGESDGMLNACSFSGSGNLRATLMEVAVHTYMCV